MKHKIQSLIASWSLLLATAVQQAEAAAAVAAATYQYPALTGSYQVGISSAELVDYGRLDLLAPTPQPRALAVSFFYPVTDKVAGSGAYAIAPVFSAVTGAAIDGYLNLTSGAAESLVSRAYLDAPLASADFPVLLFSHGFGSSRLLHTAQLEDLASHGWIIVNIDHPYDSFIVEFPDGRVVYQSHPESDEYPGATTGLVELRAKDVEFVRVALQNSTVLRGITPFNSAGNGQHGGKGKGKKRSSCSGGGQVAKLNLDVVGSFGHSLGGATSALTLLHSPDHFVCGANFDGPIYGGVLNQTVSRPFVQVARSGHSQANDPSWVALWRDLRSFRRQYEVEGTVHMSFQDFPVLRDVLGDEFPSGQSGAYGTIAGEQLLHIETALMDALFGFCLKGKPRDDLNALLQTFPELFINL